MADKTPVRRSMVGAPPSLSVARSARVPRVSNVPKTPVVASAGASRKRSKEDTEEDPDKAASVSGNEEASDASENSEEEGLDDKQSKDTPKPRRKKKKFLTDYSQKKKARDVAKQKAADLRKRQIASGLIDEEEPESEPEQEEEPEEEIPQERPVEVRRYSAFQLLCDYLLRKLQAKDPEEFFAFPVTPSMAPDYHTVITNPMDFSAIRQKIEDDKYALLDEMRKDAELIAMNALTYNNPNTVYHLAATRLSHIVRYYFSEQYLRYVFHMLPFCADVDLSRTGLSPLAAVPEKWENRRKMALADQTLAKDLKERAPKAISTRLSTRVPVLTDTKLSFLDNKDGATVLNIIGEQPADGKYTKLVDIVGPVEEGTPGMLQPIEGRQTAQGTINYLTNYGAFASFAPQFDSTWAGMKKILQSESDLLIRTYGDRANCADVLALRHMVSDCGEHMLKVVDGLLDTLTDGEHSRTIDRLEHKEKEIPFDDADLPSLLSEVETLENLGVDVSFVKDIREFTKARADESTQAMLDQQSQALVDLANLQQRRLCHQPAITLSRTHQPSQQEIQLASRVATNITSTVQQYAPPGELVSAPVVHQAMTIQDNGLDMDILNEFFT